MLLVAESGSVVWPSSGEPLWRFSYRLADAPAQEGISITQSYYKNHKVFWKASLPSLRVQYDGNACGPYKDALTYNNAVAPWWGGPKVKLTSFTANGVRALSVEAYHSIGEYRLIERWTFYEDGQVHPRLFSAGLQCNKDHRHHAYWRFDFDLDGAANDLAFEYNSNFGNVGWGPGWNPLAKEASRLKNWGTNRTWALLEKSGGQRGYFVSPSTHDGVADSFSNRDLWVLRYKGGEDRNGQQGNAYNDALLPYCNDESTDGQDIVVWYVAHLAHEAHDGSDEWHSCGPFLRPFRWNW